MQNSSKQIEIQRYLSAPEELKEKQDSLNKIIKKYNPILKDEKIDKLVTTLILNNGLDPISLTIGDIQDVQLQQDNTNETNNTENEAEQSAYVKQISVNITVLGTLTQMTKTIDDLHDMEGVQVSSFQYSESMSNTNEKTATMTIILYMAEQ